MPPKLHLLPRPSGVSIETIQELEYLLHEARLGNVSGLAYVALQSGASYVENATGRCKLIPELTLGLIRVLQKRLDELL